MVIRVQSGSSLSGRTSHTNMVWHISFLWEVVVADAKNVLVLLHTWSWWLFLSQCLGREGQAHWNTRYPMWSYTKGHVGVGNALAYCQL
jgi:hypothetical protein